MKKWPWNTILVCVGWLLVVAGVAPGTYLLARLGNTHRQKLLSAPVSLKQGGFTSPYFTAGPDGDYLIDLHWDLTPARQTSVDLDWKIVADNGSVVQQGFFNNLLRGANTVTLGSYKPISGQREQIVLDVHEDVDQGGAHAKLEIGPRETSWRYSDGLPFAFRWAEFVAGPGAILLIALAILGAKRRRASTVGV